MVVDTHTGLKCHSNGITGYGNPTEGVMIIGIAPGRDEMRTGRPFTGPSGKLLDAVLKAVGWSREQCYCTNMLCWNKDDPTPEELDACQTRLEMEIEMLKPKLILLMGKVATERFIPRKFGLVRGVPLWSEDFNCYLMGTFHPAAILRGSSGFIHDFVKDLQKIPTILSWGPAIKTEWGWSSPNGKFDFTVCQTKDDVQQALYGLPVDEYSVIDIETTNPEVEGYDTFGDKMLCLTIATADFAWVVPRDLCDGLDWPRDKRWTFHNGLFDVQGLRRYLNVRLPLVEDTMLMSYSLDERSGGHGLKGLAAQYLGVGFYAEAFKKARGKNYDQANDHLLHLYNACDGVFTARLAQHLARMCKEDNVYTLYKDLLVPAMDTFCDIQYRGVYIDLKMVHKLALEWMPRWLEAEQALQKEAREYGWDGKNEINPNSPIQLSKLLYKIIGLPGGPSTDKKHIEGLIGKHPFVDHMIAFRQLDHMIASYIIGIEDDVKRDGRAHADVKIHGTVTGRLAYTNPPLQTIPRAYVVGDDFGRLRQIFAPEDPHTHVIVEADYEKVEVWSGYAYSHDQKLYEDLTSGDFHSRVASNIFHKTPEQCTKNEWKELRHRSKYVTFGIMYGRTAKALAAGELKCSVAEAQQFLDDWLARYPDYVKWTEETKQEALREGELSSINGRKRRFRLILDNVYDTLNKAVNFPIQSIASDCMLSSMVEMHPKLTAIDSYIMTLIHDAVLVEASRKNLTATLNVMKEVIEKPRFPGMPGIPVEIAIGWRWGKTDEMKYRDGHWYVERGPDKHLVDIEEIFGYGKPVGAG